MAKETQDLLSFAAGDGVQLDIMDAKPVECFECPDCGMRSKTKGAAFWPTESCACANVERVNK